MTKEFIDPKKTLVLSSINNPFVHNILPFGFNIRFGVSMSLSKGPFCPVRDSINFASKVGIDNIFIFFDSPDLSNCQVTMGEVQNIFAENNVFPKIYAVYFNRESGQVEFFVEGKGFIPAGDLLAQNSGGIDLDIIENLNIEIENKGSVNDRIGLIACMDFRLNDAVAKMSPGYVVRFAGAAVNIANQPAEVLNDTILQMSESLIAKYQEGEDKPVIIVQAHHDCKAVQTNTAYLQEESDIAATPSNICIYEKAVQEVGDIAEIAKRSIISSAENIKNILGAEKLKKIDVIAAYSNEYGEDVVIYDKESRAWKLETGN